MTFMSPTLCVIAGFMGAVWYGYEGNPVYCAGCFAAAVIGVCELAAQFSDDDTTNNT
jgi:hypothetical protein